MCLKMCGIKLMIRLELGAFSRKGKDAELNDLQIQTSWTYLRRHPTTTLPVTLQTTTLLQEEDIL